MHRLVIALTAFLALVGAVVVAGYLFVFSAQADRLARAVPERTSLYVTAYLQPSAGQKMNLAVLLGRVPGFADAAALDQKIHEITARLLGEAGIDYEADLRPWLGNQVSLALQPNGIDPAAAEALAAVAVTDVDAAREAMNRLLPGAAESHAGTALTVGANGTWALLDDALLIGSSRQIVVAGVDADAGRSASLADIAAFADTMATLPADHLAAVYVDLASLGAAADADEVGGYSTAGLALVAEANGLRLSGSAPFDAEAAPSPAREAFELGRETPSLPDWMPAATQAEIVVFGLGQSLRALEEEVGGGAQEIADAITQLRAIAALGLGINVDEDLLPLFDHESALAVSGLETGTPSGQLLLRPSDAAAAEASLDRMLAALEERGATLTETDVNGRAVTTVDVAEVGSFAVTIQDGIIVAGLRADDVEAALTAGETGGLADTDAYRDAWELAGAHAGNELWVDAAALVDAAEDELGVTGDARDILLEIGAVAMTAPARDDRSEFTVVLTVR